MIDVNVPVTNVELVNIMNEFINEKTSQNEIELINQIQYAHFLTPMNFEGEIEDNIVKKDSTMSFKLLTNTSNESFYMAFTDWTELGKWSTSKEETLIIKYDDLKTMVLNDINNIKGFVINPFNQNIIITSELIDYFTNRKSEVTIKEKTKVMLGEPANYPQEMVNELTRFFKQYKEIESAYLLLAHYESIEKPNLLLIIDSTNEKELYSQIGSLAQKFLAKDEYIDIVQLKSEFGVSSTKNVKPFYRRKKWKLF